MDLNVRIFKDNCVIDIKGEIDIYNAHRIKEAVFQMMQKRVCAFVLNLKRVTYIDSSGIGALLAVNAALMRSELPLRIVSVPPAVMKVMQLTRLIGFLPVERTELEALDELEVKRKGARS
ncbi:MAG TPA: STAS domain-containing protein [Spirochaetia bacterium]|nr:STAS domain-containing protein [Spirochaetia bacterium]